MSRTYQQLPQAAFIILLALSLRPLHGYGIKKQVMLDSDGKVNLVPGTLYASIKQLLAAGYIEILPRPATSRRQYYQLTFRGMRTLQEEAEYYKAAVALAQLRQVIAAE